MQIRSSTSLYAGNVFLLIRNYFMPVYMTGKPWPPQRGIPSKVAVARLSGLRASNRIHSIYLFDPTLNSWIAWYIKCQFSRKDYCS